MSDLADRNCIPCRGGTAPLTAAQIAPLLAQLPGWSAANGHHLCRRFTLADFAGALELANRIGAIAEQQNHHPDLHLAWGMLEVTIWTHTIDGLTESDFVFAAKCDHVAAGLAV